MFVRFFDEWGAFSVFCSLMCSGGGGFSNRELKFNYNLPKIVINHHDTAGLSLLFFRTFLVCQWELIKISCDIKVGCVSFLLPS